MKLLLTTMLVLAVAVVPSVVVGADDTKGGSPSTSPSQSSGASPGSRMGSDPSPSGPSASPITANGPASKDDCMKGGWTKFRSQNFKSQADCMNWVGAHEKGKQ